MINTILGISIIIVALVLTYNVLKSETSLKTNILVLMLFPIGLINVFADLMFKINYFFIF